MNVAELKEQIDRKYREALDALETLKVFLESTGSSIATTVVQKPSGIHQNQSKTTKSKP